jgi:hypothetical protein
VSTLTPVEKRSFESLFGMGTGYVMDFTNQSFAQLFRDVVGLEIYDDCYALHGTSKAQRLRGFWELEDDATVAKVLSTMIDIWKADNDAQPQPKSEIGYNECKKIVNRLMGGQLAVDIKIELEAFGLQKIKFASLGLDPKLTAILEQRIADATVSLKYGLSLSVIILCGSVLEGTLLAIATQHNKDFFQSAGSPKDKQGKPKTLREWNLAQLIDASCAIGLLGTDVRKTCHALRDFRNYIHPWEQLTSGFNPDADTASMCMKVLEMAIHDIAEKKW